MISLSQPERIRSETTVRLSDVWKVYQIGAIEYTALKGVSLSIRRGEFVSIVGPSGSGKTSLLNLVGTLDVPTRGEVYLDGVPTSKLRGNELASLRNRTLGFVFQSYNLVPHLSAIQNVELPMMAAGVAGTDRRRRAAQLLEQLGLGDKSNKKPGELSGGEQQRVVIARALVNDPSIILADEPTGNLDSKAAASVASILRSVSEEAKVTVVLVTHNMEVARYSQRIVFLRDGEVEKEELTR